MQNEPAYVHCPRSDPIPIQKMFPPYFRLYILPLSPGPLLNALGYSRLDPLWTKIVKPCHVQCLAGVSLGPQRRRKGASRTLLLGNSSNSLCLYKKGIFQNWITCNFLWPCSLHLSFMNESLLKAGGKCFFFVPLTVYKFVFSYSQLLKDWFCPCFHLSCFISWDVKLRAWPLGVKDPWLFL